MGLDAAIGHGEGIDGLHFVADGDAASASDALVGIADNGERAVVHRFFDQDVGQGVGVHAQVVGQGLKLAFVVGHAGGAHDFVVGKDHFHEGLAVGAQFFGIGADLHPFGDGSAASTLGSGIAGQFNHANTAVGSGRQIGMVAQAGDVETVLVRGLNDGHGIRNFQMMSIYPDVDCFSHNSL